MKYFPEASYAEPTLDAAIPSCPATTSPTFLRAGEGPRVELGELRATDDGRARESRDELTMLSVEGTRPVAPRRTSTTTLIRRFFGSTGACA